MAVLDLIPYAKHTLYNVYVSDKQTSITINLSCIAYNNMYKYCQREVILSEVHIAVYSMYRLIVVIIFKQDLYICI